MATVANPIKVIVNVRTRLRPSRSPKWPNRMPPRGRAQKPTATEANEKIVPIAGSLVGKNAVSNTSVATETYRKKSSHSMTVPITLATNILRTVRPFLDGIEVGVVALTLWCAVRGVDRRRQKLGRTPPLTPYDSPVMYAASSLARNETIAAMSSGRPTRPTRERFWA